MPPLKNLRHEQFVQLYFGDPKKNAERAYAAAGFDVKTSKDKSTSASSCAVRLLRDAKVQKRLSELIERQLHRMDISADRVMREMGRIAFSDPRRVVGKDGAIIDPRHWDDETAAAVAGIEVEKLFEGTGKDRTFIGYTQKLKHWDKNTALTNLAKHFKLLQEPESAMSGMFAGSQVQINVYLPKKEIDVVSNGHAIPNGHSNGSD